MGASPETIVRMAESLDFEVLGTFDCRTMNQLKKLWIHGSTSLDALICPLWHAKPRVFDVCHNFS